MRCFLVVFLLLALTGQDSPPPSAASRIWVASSPGGRDTRERPSRLRCGPPDTARAPGGTSRRTTAPPPVIAPSPMVTGATKVLLAPVFAPLPTLVWCLATPS